MNILKTEEEKTEQKALREEYLTEYRRALRGGGNEKVVLREDGTKVILKK